MKTRLLLIFLLLSMVSCGDNGSNDKLVNTIEELIENNEYTVIYFGAHWCGPCNRVFENKMSEIIDADFDKLGCITIFFDSGNKVRNNENIMKYSPVIMPSIGGLLDKNRANNILKESLQDYEDVNYMPIMILCDKKGNIINRSSEGYIQFDKNYLDTIIKGASINCFEL